MMHRVDSVGRARQTVVRTVPPRFRRRRLVAALSVAVLAPAAVASETAAVASATSTALGSIGQTQLQQQTGDAVTTVCRELSRASSLNAAQRDLFDRCGSMVQNANAIVGSGPVDKSLGLTPDQLAAAVQTVAGEEVGATQSISTGLASNQINTAIARLVSVRSGVRFGLAGLDIGTTEFLADLDPRLQGGATGGAAGADLVGKWGFFANAHYGFGDRDGTAREDGFDYDRWGLTAGADYRFTDNFIVGGLLSYSSVNSNFDTSRAVPGGGVDADAWGLGLYGTYYTESFYVDALVGYNQTDYDIDRRILLPLGNNPGPAAVPASRAAKASTDSNDWTFSLGGGMDFSSGNLTYGPYARLNYVNVSIDGYSERGADGLNLTVDDQDWESLTTTLGGQLSAALSQSWGVLVPQLRVGWVHEFQNDANTFTAFYTADPRRNPLFSRTDNPDRDYAELGVGISAVLPNGIQAYFDYQTLLGHEYINDHLFGVGLRTEF
jgi:outer membrane autotransporter protein